MNDLMEQFGRIDIYLFDQLLRGRIDSSQGILDAGCGRGRNLVYFLKHGFDVSAVDLEAENVIHVRELLATWAPHLEETRIRTAPVESMPFADDAFDIVISNAVLHFARDPAHFDAMVTEMLRVLAPGGMLFARLASSIGIEDTIRPLGNERYRIRDGSDRFLVDEATLLAWTKRAGGTLLDPIKTTNVQGLRCMTTWVLQVPLATH